MSTPSKCIYMQSFKKTSPFFFFFFWISPRLGCAGNIYPPFFLLNTLKWALTKLIIEDIIREEVSTPAIKQINYHKDKCET